MRLPRACARVAPARARRSRWKGRSVSCSSSGDSAVPSRLNSLPLQAPLPSSATDGGAPGFVASRLARRMSMSVRVRASANRRRPSSIHSRRSCRGSPSSSSSKPKSQLPGPPFGLDCRRTSGATSRNSGRRTRPSSSGQDSTCSTSCRALAISGSSAHSGFPSRSPSAVTVVSRPRSTSRSPPISNSRPVRASTSRCTGPRNQFQSHSRTSSTMAAHTAPTIPSVRRDGRVCRRGR